MASVVADRPRTRPRLGRRQVRPGGITLGLGLLVVAACVLVPIGLGLYTALWSEPVGSGGHFTWSNISQAVAQHGAGTLILNTLVLTVGAAGGGTILGVLLAWIVTSTDVPLRRVLIVLPMAPALIPGLMKDTAWISLYSPRSGLVNVELERWVHWPGPIFNIYSMAGMVITLMLSTTPITYLVMLPAFTNIGKSLHEASRVVGAGKTRTLFRVVLPATRPAIFSAVALSALLVAASFETPILIGLPGNILTYISAIYESLQGGILPDYNLAAAQSLIYMLLTIGLLVWYLLATRRERRFAVVMGRDYKADRMRLGGWRWAALGLILAYFLVAFVQPFAGTVIVSLLPYYTATVDPLQHWTTSNYAGLFNSHAVLQGIETSLILSLVVSILTTLVALMLAWTALKTRLPGRRVFELIGTLPIGVPPLVYAVFLLMSVLFIPGLSLLYNSIYPLVVADVVVLLPFAIRIVSSAVLQLQNDLIESPRTLGAGGMRAVRTIVMPLLRIPLLSSMVLIFALSFRELGAVIFLTGTNTVLFPTVIFDQWETGQQTGTVAALNILSVVVSGGALIIGQALLRLGSRRRPAPPLTV
jgi:iron(III) transport system permease protein